MKTVSLKQKNHSDKKAAKAQNRWNKRMQYSKFLFTSDIEIQTQNLLYKLLVVMGISPDGLESQKLISEGKVKINQKIITDEYFSVSHLDDVFVLAVPNLLYKIMVKNVR